MKSLRILLDEIRSCTVCANDLPCAPRPIVAASTESRILIVGQAPGIRVQQSGVPWDDPSGERLRDWMGITKELFYDPSLVAIVPMGFCYPGTGDNGDLPPRPECAPLWHDPLLSRLNKIELTLVVGLHAQQFRFAKLAKKNLTETVRHWQDYAPHSIPIPHPSPRNNRWLKRNPWFESEVLPNLRNRVQDILSA